MQTDKTFRVRLPREQGSLARLISAISQTGVMFSNIETRYIGLRYAYRNITVEVNSEAQFEECLAAARGVSGVIIDDVVDEVLHLHDGGKLLHRGRYEVRSLAELREVYTPGVAKVCMAIERDPSLVRRYTTAGNTVAVISNGSRVLGLGNIGPQASLPVMESKALFYGQFVDLNAVPIVLDVTTVREFVETVARIAPTFAGIHLEDIQSPDCIEIENRLVESLSIPVMHDDQHGTAVVALAAMMNMARLAERRLDGAILAQVGLGAAGLAIASLARAAGVKTVLGCDLNPQAARFAADRGVPMVDLQSAFAQADVVCLATGKPGLVQPSMIRRGQIILAMSNPLPEIEPNTALAAGAAMAADGRTVNNLLCYPGMFKGAIAAGAGSISIRMKLAAAQVIAARAEGGELLPDPLDKRTHAAVAQAVEAVARERLAE